LENLREPENLKLINIHDVRSRDVKLVRISPYDPPLEMSELGLLAMAQI
jgi:hypothetical protein